MLLLRSSRKRFFTVVLIFVLVIGIGGVGYWAIRSRNPVKPAIAMPRERVVSVQKRNLIQTVSGTGIITPARDVELTFDVAGKVSSIKVNTTQSVKKGDVLAVLENTTQELAYLSAKRELELAQLESAPSVVKEKELSLRLAEADLEATRLKAPFDGVVAEIDVEEGEWVNTAKPVIRLIDTSHFYVEVNVDEVDIRHVQIGQPVTITLDAYPELKFQGNVIEIGIVPQHQGELVLFPVKIELERPDSRVRTGMSAEANIVVKKAEGVLAVPLDAVVEANGRSLVTVVTETGPQPTPVELGISDGLFVEVKRGLNEGDRVLASNYQLYRTLLGESTSQQQRQQPTPFGPGLGGGRRR